MDTGEVIKFLRTTRFLTQEQLGEILGVKKSAIQKYESGAITNLKIDVIRKLCSHFDVPPYVFIFPEAIADFSELEFSIKDYGSHYKKLNMKGRIKAHEYLGDLAKIDDYKLKPSE